MENKLSRQLNWYYYGMMALTLIAVTVFYLLQQRGLLVPIDRMSTAGKVLQYVVIFDVLLSLPLGLYGFNKVCQRLRRITVESIKYREYHRYAAIRIVLVSQPMLLGIVAFYLLGGYMSMFWIAAIGAIGWYFTKPTPKKIELELNPPQEEY